MSTQTREGLTIKDLVTLGIFTAISYIFIMIGGTPFAINPVLTFYMPLGGALLSGPVFLLMIAKAPKRYMITIFGIIIGLIFTATGMHWSQGLGYASMAILGDILAGTKQYKSIKMNICAYISFCIGATGPYIVYTVNPASWINAMLSGGTEQSYLDAMSAATYDYVLVVIIIGTVVIAGLSGFVGSKMLKKQFEKAGIIA